MSHVHMHARLHMHVWRRHTFAPARNFLPQVPLFFKKKLIRHCVLSDFVWISQIHTYETCGDVNVYMSYVHMYDGSFEDTTHWYVLHDSFICVVWVSYIRIWCIHIYVHMYICIHIRTLLVQMSHLICVPWFIQIYTYE